MGKEIDLVDLFDTANATRPEKVSKRAWRHLAGAMYGAMRRGRSAEDIMEAVSQDLRRKALQPYVTDLAIGIQRLVKGG